MEVWERAHAEGRKVPLQFYMRPEIEPENRHLWIAFCDLTSERSIGMGVGSIPRSRIVEYVQDEMGLEGDEAAQAVRIVRQVDDEYLHMTNSPKDVSTAIPISDVAGISRLFEVIEARRGADGTS